jgi:hypothetical protein
VPLQSVVLRPSPAAAAGETPEDRPGVFLVRENKVAFQPVTTGIIGGLAIEVTGVEENAVVVTGPFQALRSLEDGAPVRVRQEGQR